MIQMVQELFQIGIRSHCLTLLSTRFHSKRDRHIRPPLALNTRTSRLNAQSPCLAKALKHFFLCRLNTHNPYLFPTFGHAHPFTLHFARCDPLTKYEKTCNHKGAPIRGARKKGSLIAPFFYPLHRKVVTS